MSQVQIQRSDVASYVPATLLVGAMFYNSADKRLYAGNAANIAILVADNPDDISAKIAALEAFDDSTSHTFVQALAPINKESGDFWFDTQTANLKIWDGSYWKLAVNIAASSITGVYPVTTDILFDHIVLTTNEQSDIDLAQRCIASATAFAESYTGRFFIVRNVTHSYDQFPRMYMGKKQPLTLVGGTANSIASITYYNPAYTSESLSTYRQIDKNGRTHIYPAMGSEWPSDVATGEPDVVAVTYEVGTLPADVPAPVRSAILLIAASLWEHRENEIVGTNIKSLKPIIAAKDLLHPYKLR